jgi:hypothetical protein
MVITFTSVKRFGLFVVGLMGLEGNTTVNREVEAPGIIILTIQGFFPAHRYFLF